MTTRFPDRCFAFDQFGPLSIRPCHGTCWAAKRHPDRLRATYRRTHGVRYFHGYYNLAEDGLTSAARATDCKPKKVSMVIDDTGSMRDVIGSVSASLGSFVQSTPEDEYTPLEPDHLQGQPTDVGTTEERDQALSMVNGLTASGGGDCPEDALGGISSGLAALGNDPDTDKQMVVATDASARAAGVKNCPAGLRAKVTQPLVAPVILASSGSGNSRVE